MKHVQMMNRTRGTLLGTRIGLADRIWLRARGYLARAEPRLGEGLLLVPCRSVHMMGVRFPLDVLFLDRSGKVAAAYPRLEPGARAAAERNAEYALELPAGTIELTGTRVGDQLSWAPMEEVREGHAERRRMPRFEGWERRISTTRGETDMGVHP